jgi:hypothetical protein
MAVAGKPEIVATSARVQALEIIGVVRLESGTVRYHGTEGFALDIGDPIVIIQRVTARFC